MVVTYLTLIVLLASISIVLLYYSDSLTGVFEVVVSFFGLVGSAIALLASIAGLFLIYGWFAASYQAQIINREYGTQYTQEEVFYASNVIDTVRMLDRKRIELNGDLMSTPSNP